MTIARTQFFMPQATLGILLVIFESLNAGVTLAQSPAAQQQIPRDLRITVDKFMGILEKGQPDGLLGLLSSEGVVFGIESDPIPASRIRVELQEKRGVYCLLFETDCLRKQMLQEWKRTSLSGNLEAVLSLREAITSASKKNIHINSLSKQGWVSWKLELNERPGAGYINATNFGFALERSGWKLKSVEYPGYR